MSSDQGQVPDAGDEVRLLEEERELAALWQHDYGTPMPELRYGGGLGPGPDAERLVRLIGVGLKQSVASAQPAVQSNLGARYAYVFDEARLKDPGFAATPTGRLYKSLLKETKAIAGGGAQVDVNLQDIVTLPADERPAKFALELAYEGRTARAVLRIVRVATCNPKVREPLTAIAGGLVGADLTAKAVAAYLAAQVPLLALLPAAALAGVVTLVYVFGIDGFCGWAEGYLTSGSDVFDLPAEGIRHG